MVIMGGFPFDPAFMLVQRAWKSLCAISTEMAVIAILHTMAISADIFQASAVPLEKAILENRYRPRPLQVIWFSLRDTQD